MSQLTIYDIHKLIWQVFPDLTGDEKAWVVRNYNNVVWWIASYGQLETQLGSTGVGENYFLGIGVLSSSNILPQFAGAKNQVKTFIKKLHEYFPNTLPPPTNKDAVYKFQSGFYKSTVEEKGKELSGEQAYNIYTNRLVNVAKYMKPKVDEQSQKLDVTNWLNIDKYLNAIKEIGKEKTKEEQEKQSQEQQQQGESFWDKINPFKSIQSWNDQKKNEFVAGLQSAVLSIILLIFGIAMILVLIKS